MPKARLEFNLPDERGEYALANNAGKLASIIWEWTQFLREQVKYGKDGDKWEPIKDKWWELLKEEGYDPYEQ